MKNVLICTAALFVGHVVYGYLLSDYGLDWGKVFERTFFQFGALAAYWWLFGEKND